jgi:hypothetical protein
MSDHFDASDRRTDITDLYVFPGRRVDRTVLVLDVNPEPSTAEASVDPAASYEIKIDTDGDMLANVAHSTIHRCDNGCSGTRWTGSGPGPETGFSWWSRATAA